MLGYFSALLSGDQDTLRSALLFGAVLGGILVGVGILWEAKKLDAATATVFVGIVIEAICTIFLFVTDERISRQQQSQIEIASKRAADAEEKLVAYRAQRYLTQGQKTRMAEVTNDFPSVPFVAYTALDQEPWTLVLDIASNLRTGGWKWLPVPDGLQPIDGNPSEGKTIADHVVVAAPPRLEREAKALAAALTDPTVIGMDDV